MSAYIAGIACHLPDNVVTNEDLQVEHPDWDFQKIEAKVGIAARRIARAGECASDLGFAAAERLLQEGLVDRSKIDYLLLCTQSPDYVLPTTACILQHRLGLPTTCAAIDYNQGCSGYVYGLGLAKALVESGMACNVLLVTAETYSRYIHPDDRSVRVLFGDGASATLIRSEGPGAKIGVCRQGTDGSGAENLIVSAGASRRPYDECTREGYTDENGSTRTAENLFMDGQALFAFTLQRVPEIVTQAAEAAGRPVLDFDWYVFHQANLFMNDRIRQKLKIPAEKTPMFLRDCGNTVSTTIPLVLATQGHRFKTGDAVMTIGFGVGYSWGATVLEWGDVFMSPPSNAE